MKPDLSHLLKKTTVLPRLFRDEPTQKRLDVASAADLRRLHRKTADSEICSVPEISFPIVKGNTYILLVTLGDGLIYGANDNADLYPGRSGVEVILPEPCGGRPKLLRLGKGLVDTHASYRKYGAVYKHHKTEPEHGVPRSGNIVFERYRPDLHRGELVVELPHDKWEKELADFENGMPLLWSQGSGVPADFCRRCGYEFKKGSKSRCRHIENARLCIGDDGVQNVILCTDAVFYDISYVGNNPAAKIAWGLLKVAECEDPEDIVAAAPILSRKGEFRKLVGIRMRPELPLLSELVAEEEAILPQDIDGFRNTCSADPGAELAFLDACGKTDIADLLSALARLNVVLSPTQWWRIFSAVGREPSGVSGFVSALRDVFRRVTRETGGDFVEDADWLPSRSPDISLLNSLQPLARPFRRRPVTIIVDVRHRAQSEPARVTPTPADRYLAREYAKYQLACLSTFAGPEDARWCALVNASGM